MTTVDELVQYYIINKDLNMSAGKIAGQVGHVADDIADYIITLRYYEPNTYMLYKQWKEEFNKKKIILEANTKKLEELVALGFYYIRDLGLTEIPKDSLTCVGLGIMWRSEAQQFIKRLQLLK